MKVSPTSNKYNATTFAPTATKARDAANARNTTKNDQKPIANNDKMTNDTNANNIDTPNDNNNAIYKEWKQWTQLREELLKYGHNRKLLWEKAPEIAEDTAGVPDEYFPAFVAEFIAKLNKRIKKLEATKPPTEGSLAKNTANNKNTERPREQSIVSSNSVNVADDAEMEIDTTNFYTTEHNKKDNEQDDMDTEQSRKTKHDNDKSTNTGSKLTEQLREPSIVSSNSFELLNDDKMEVETIAINETEHNNKDKEHEKM